MAALPYIQMYVADYLADTMHLSTEEHGAYLLLIFNYWQTGKPIRADRIPPIVKMSPERWAEIKHTIEEFFSVENGVWTHGRIEEDLEAVLSKSIKASRAGKKSAQKRALQATDKQKKSNERSAVVAKTLQRNGNHTDTDTDTDAKTDTKDKIDSAQLALTVQGKNNAASPRGTTVPDEPINGHDYIPQMSYTEQDVVDLYNKMLPELIPIKKITWRLQHDIRNIHTTTEIGCHEIKHWTNFFKRVKRSDWLTGRANGKPSRYSLRKLIEPECYAKIAEGTYD